MRTKITNLINIINIIATGCIAALTLTVTAPSHACDKNQDGAKTVETGAAAAACFSSKEAATQAAVLTVKSEEGECPIERSANHVLAALEKIDGCCGEKCPGRPDMILAVRSLASVKEGLVCEQKLAMLTGEPAVLAVRSGAGSGCCPAGAGEAKAAKLVVSNGDVSSCGSADAAKTATLVVSKGEGSSCGSAQKLTDAKLVATAGGTCSGKGSAENARYVAFGCEKSDRIARAAAQAYLAVMTEIKATSGAEGCAYSTASELLATLLEDMRNEAQAAAVSETAVADAK